MRPVLFPSSRPALRLLLLGDFHGQLQKIPASALADRADFDAIVSAGDFFGLSPRTYAVSLRLRSLHFALEQEENVAHARRLAREYKKLGKRYEHLVAREEVQNFVHARRIMDYLDSFGKPVFIVPGNWEFRPPFFGSAKEYRAQLARYRALLRGYKNITDLHLSSTRCKGYTFVGLGVCQMPENVFYYDPVLAEECYHGEKHLRLYKHWMRRMQPLFERARKQHEKVIFISHNQPYGTSLDLITSPDSPAQGEHYGSCVTRKLIDDFQPVLCVAAHIHETRGTACIGTTLCVNSGFAGHGEYGVVALGKRGELPRVQLQRVKGKESKKKRANK